MEVKHWGAVIGLAGFVVMYLGFKPENSMIIAGKSLAEIGLYMIIAGFFIAFVAAVSGGGGRPRKGGKMPPMPPMGGMR